MLDKVIAARRQIAFYLVRQLGRVSGDVCVKSCAHHTGWRLQPVARFIHACKPSTHVLTPPYIGAPSEVARDNMIALLKHWPK